MLYICIIHKQQFLAKPNFEKTTTGSIQFEKLYHLLKSTQSKEYSIGHKKKLQQTIEKGAKCQKT